MNWGSSGSDHARSTERWRESEGTYEDPEFRSGTSGVYCMQTDQSGTDLEMIQGRGYKVEKISGVDLFQERCMWRRLFFCPNKNQMTR